MNFTDQWLVTIWGKSKALTLPLPPQPQPPQFAYNTTIPSSVEVVQVKVPTTMTLIQRHLDFKNSLALESSHSNWCEWSSGCDLGLNNRHSQDMSCNGMSRSELTLMICQRMSPTSWFGSNFHQIQIWIWINSLISIWHSFYDCSRPPAGHSPNLRREPSHPKLQSPRNGLSNTRPESAQLLRLLRMVSADVSWGEKTCLTVSLGLEDFRQQRLVVGRWGGSFLHPLFDLHNLIPDWIPFNHWLIAEIYK